MKGLRLMQHVPDYQAIVSRLHHLTQEISAGCDHEFDAGQEELEREFAELRLLVPAFYGR